MTLWCIWVPLSAVDGGWSELWLSQWNTEMADTKDPPIEHKADAIVHTQKVLTPQDETRSSNVIFHQKQKGITN